MHYISKAEDWVINLYPENEEGSNYKLSDYSIIEPYRDGYILFHTITWSLYFMSEEEYNNILSNNFLIKNKVVLSESINEDEIAESAYLKRTVTHKIGNYDTIQNFVVYTTNACNARCPYCYEHNKNGDMSIDVAEKLVDFIIDKCKQKEVHIQWFGGEPLKNIPIIDYIAQKLKNNNIKLRSSIISNCSLFTPEVIEKAVNLWNLRKIQVTIDGPEQMYNKIKNYKDLGNNAYQTVVDNIKYILKNTDIRVIVRCNLTDTNVDYIDEMIDKLNNALLECNSNKLSLYFKIVYQQENNIELLKETHLYEKYLDLLKRHLPESEKRFLLKKTSLMSCMADKCSSVVVSTDGILHNCEHLSKNNIIGNVVSGIIYQDTIDKTLDKGGKHLDFCKKNKCKLIPICTKVDFCDPEKRCTKIANCEFENEKKIRSLKYTVDYYFKKLEEKTKKIGEE